MVVTLTLNINHMGTIHVRIDDTLTRPPSFTRTIADVRVSGANATRK